MRTVSTLSILLGLAVTASEPKKPQPIIGTAESIALSAIVGESQRLSEQQKKLQEQYSKILQEACQREHKQDACTLGQKGEIIATPKDDKKK